MDLVRFFEIASELKRVKRTGWIKRGVRDVESVADHTFMVTLLCMTMPQTGIDKEKAMKLAIVHDVAEVVTGDVVSTDKCTEIGEVTKKERMETERKAMKKVLSGLDDSIAKEIMGLWEEYTEGKTPEAIFVSDMDVAETMLQALEYHKKGNYEKPLDSFWEEKKINLIKNKNIKTLMRRIIDQNK
ncbi:HD domain-containing protein [Candidatus Woesearchaeota archaeon]|nr:HD domain-containing protein [Candidatus Woesearchaeota archaeon]